MIYIPPLPLQTMTVRMQELTIGQALSIASMPIALKEASTTAFLRYAARNQDDLTDPLFWTVEERMIGVAHYLAATSDGNPDFAIGDDARFSQYLIADSHARVLSADAGAVAGDAWKVRQLCGYMAESIERMTRQSPMKGAAHWLAGRMAFQMVRDGEELPDPAQHTDGQADLWLQDRLKILSEFPESDFMALLVAYEVSRHKLTHLFNVTSDADGLACLQNTEQGGAGTLPARFPVRSCIGSWAVGYSGKSH